MLTFSDFFKSFYYSNTYVPPVDLSDRGVDRHLLATKRPEVAKIAQSLISDPEVKGVLSAPISYDYSGTALKNNATLKNKGFKLLSLKPKPGGGLMDFYSVVEHTRLPGWLIKAGGARTTAEMIGAAGVNDRGEVAIFNAEDSLLRIAMAKRISKIAREAGIELIVPKKKLVVYAGAENETEPTRKYCVICQKLDILSSGETIEHIKQMNKKNQKQVAKQISTIVQKAGLVDASFHNIRFTRAGKLALIDTEPAGLMVVKKEGVWNRLFGPTGASVEKYGRIGLYALKSQTSRAACQLLRGNSQVVAFGDRCESGLEPFRRQIEKEYQTVISPKFSKLKVGIAVLSLGLLPLIHAIMAIVKIILIVRNQEKIKSVSQAFVGNLALYGLGLNSVDPQLLQKFQAELVPLQRKHLSYIDGVVASIPVIPGQAS